MYLVCLSLVLRCNLCSMFFISWKRFLPADKVLCGLADVSVGGCGSLQHGDGQDELQAPFGLGGTFRLGDEGERHA